MDVEGSDDVRNKLDTIPPSPSDCCVSASLLGHCDGLQLSGRLLLSVTLVHAASIQYKHMKLGIVSL